MGNNFKENIGIYNNRFYFGSAKALDKETENKLKELDHENEFHKLNKDMRKFFEENGFQMLQKRIDIELDFIKETFSKVLNNHGKELTGDYNIDDELRIEWADKQGEYKSNAKEKAQEEMDKINEEFCIEVANKEIEKEIINKLKENMIFVNEKELKKTRRKLTAAIGGIPTPQRLNEFHRNQVYSDYIAKFGNILKEVFQGRIESKEQEVFSAIQSALTNDASVSKIVVEEIKKLIKSFSEDLPQTNSYFVSLTKRFSQSILEILINHPIGTDGRSYSVNENLDSIEILSLIYPSTEHFYSMLLYGDESNGKGALRYLSEIHINHGKKINNQYIKKTDKEEKAETYSEYPNIKDNPIKESKKEYNSIFEFINEFNLADSTLIEVLSNNLHYFGFAKVNLSNISWVKDYINKDSNLRKRFLEILRNYLGI